MKPKIIKMNPNGTFLVGNNTISQSYDIYTILELKQMIPQLVERQNRGLSVWDSIGKKYQIGGSTVQYLCYMIETGDFDKYIAQWENRLKWEK